MPGEKPVQHHGVPAVDVFGHMVSQSEGRDGLVQGSPQLVVEGIAGIQRLVVMVQDQQTDAEFLTVQLQAGVGTTDDGHAVGAPFFAELGEVAQRRGTADGHLTSQLIGHDGPVGPQQPRQGATDPGSGIIEGPGDIQDSRACVRVAVSVHNPQAVATVVETHRRGAGELLVDLLDLIGDGLGAHAQVVHKRLGVGRQVPLQLDEYLCSTVHEFTDLWQARAPPSPHTIGGGARQRREAGDQPRDLPPVTVTVVPVM